MSPLVLTLRVLAVTLGSVAFLMVNIVVVLYFERKVMAHTQMRLGPMRTGWHGVLQPVADAIKLLSKEDIIPDRADRTLFVVAPFITFVPSFFLYVATPWVAAWLGVDFEVDLFLVFAVAAIITVGLLVGGWASYSKYALLGAFRAAAQQISYEVPLLLSVAGVAMLAGSLRFSDIVGAQGRVWFAVLQPLALVLYVIALHAELNRTPFDMPEAESELVAGYSVEYSSMRFAVFFLAEYGNDFSLSLIGAMLFLGGWNGPVLPGWVWLLLKTYLIVFLTLWSRSSFPRIRVDQLMSLGWKVLMPFGIANLVITAVGIVTGSMPLMVALEAAGVVLLGVAVRWSSREGARSPGAVADVPRGSDHAAAHGEVAG